MFDPGIDALSIPTRILSYAFFLMEIDLWVLANQQTSIAAYLAFTDAAGTSIHAEFDQRHDANELWQIDVTTHDGTLRLTQGGRQLAIDGAEIDIGPEREHPSLYAHFLEPITSGGSNINVRPPQHVVDAMLLGRCHLTDSFVP